MQDEDGTGDNGPRVNLPPASTSYGCFGRMEPRLGGIASGSIGTCGRCCLTVSACVQAPPGRGRAGGLPGMPARAAGLPGMPAQEAPPVPAGEAPRVRMLLPVQVSTFPRPSHCSSAYYRCYCALYIRCIHLPNTTGLRRCCGPGRRVCACVCA